MKVIVENIFHKTETIIDFDGWKITDYQFNKIKKETCGKSTCVCCDMSLKINGESVINRRLSSWYPKYKRMEIKNK